jgi:RHS repeat-associated protein
MAGISDKALKIPYAENKYRFNGGNELQNKEFFDGSGLETYDATHRMYDSQIGRFWQIDPLPDFNVDISPYSFSNNDPISFNDPLGDTTTLPEVTVTAKKPLDTENGQVYAPQSWLSNFWSGNRVWVGHQHVGNKWYKANYEVDRSGYLTGRLAPNLLTFDAPVGEEPINPKVLLRLKNFIRGRYVVYRGVKEGLDYIGKAKGGIELRYTAKELEDWGITVVKGLENLPNNATALGVEQIMIDLNGGAGTGELANKINATVKQAYIDEATYYLDNNMPGWQQILKIR